MSFPLCRLPLLAIREMIQSMDTREILYLSVLSKKSANFVMLSIPKNSLSADFIFRKDGFQFELMPKGFTKQAVNNFPVVPYRTENESVFIGLSTCGLYIQCQWRYISEVEESIRKLFYRFSKIFKNSKFYIRFEYNTREEFAMEMMRFAWGNGFPLDRIAFYLQNSSPKSIQELLNRCNGHDTSLHIGTKLPKGFRCTPPPGGYKFEFFRVVYAHWVNLDDFLQCRVLSLWGGVLDSTPEYLNNLLKKIINMECRLERFLFQLKSIKLTDFPEIVRGLSDSEIQQNGRRELQFERKDGLKLLVRLSSGSLILETLFYDKFIQDL